MLILTALRSDKQTSQKHDPPGTVAALNKKASLTKVNVKEVGNGR